MDDYYLCVSVFVFLLKRKTNKTENSVNIHATLMVVNQKSIINGQLVTFTRKELQIVELLLRNQKRIFSKQELYELIWKRNYLEDENTINVHISTLRKKFEQYDKTNTYIETVWGMGIRLMGKL